MVWDAANGPEDLTTRGSAGRAYVGANEEVLTWDIKKGELVGRWSVEDDNAQVTVIRRSQVDPDVFAVGYEDGKIRIWDSRTATVIMTFNGHKTAVTQLKFDRAGVRLASGSKDTDVILWDLVAEVGLYRLRGHKDQITSIHFLTVATVDTESRSGPDSDSYLLSTSKDALIKVWDLSTQHCIETHVTQTNGECWAVGLSPDGGGCITAGNDGELKVWSINTAALHPRSPVVDVQDAQILHERGAFYRHGKDRTVAVTFHPQRDLMAIHGSEKVIELWRIRSETEVKKSLQRKRKRRKENGDGAAVKGTRRDDANGKDDEIHADIDISAAHITEVFVPYVMVRTGGKVRSMDWAGGKSGKPVSILVATSNNQLELFDVTLSEARKKSKGSEPPEYSRVFSVDTPGHRADIRCLALSSDDRMLASACHGSLKIWNVKTQSCLRTLECGYALCATFLPGDKIVVIGTREGTLEVFDIAASNLLDTIPAHERDIWSLQVSPDGKSLLTGSADKTAKFWEFKVIQEDVLGTSRRTAKLTLVPTRTLKVADDILSVRFSPDGRLLAVSTLDNTVKVFFLDTLKLYLTLYGHKLPVLSMDISHDSKLIVTSSADKNVRVWGLDFGDCHKAFFAHQDSILSVAFVPTNDQGHGHHFFSASKDKVIKYFDGDKFEQIQKLVGHHGEIWALAVAHSGQFLVSASHDKSVRLWQQTDEQIFLEEEREKELEELYENTLLTSLEQDDPHQGEVGDAGKQTTQTLMAGERIAEALELGLEDLDLMRRHEQATKMNAKAAPPARHPVFVAHHNVPASVYVLDMFQRVPSASLQDALLVLSFSHLPALFTFLGLWAQEGRNIPLTCRVLFFMLKTHHKQIVSARMMRSLLEDVRGRLRQTLAQQEHELGFNLAGLRLLGRRLNERSQSDYVVDEDADDGRRTPWDGAGRSIQGRGNKRAFINVA